jgi:hypothetical protein
LNHPGCPDLWLDWISIARVVFSCPNWLCPLHTGPLTLRLTWAIALFTSHDRPGDPCHLVGESDSDQTGWFSLQQLICPDVDGGFLVPRTLNDGSGSNDKEMPQIAVPHFRYAHSLLAAGRVLLWHQPEPSGKLPAGTEHFRVAHSGGQRGRGD